MFFVISKLLVYFIYPITWIVVALVFSVFIKTPKGKKVSLLIATAILLLFSNPFLLNQFARVWDIHTMKPVGKYSCAIVLGGFVSEDRVGNGYLNMASDRFIQGIKLKLSGTTDKLLFSGGNSELVPGKFREAAWIGQELKFYNIPDSSILIEQQARNTLENVKYSKIMLQQRKLQPPYLLVTSAFHMRRSLQTFKKMGLDVEPYSCNYIAGQEKTTVKSFIPSAEALSNWGVYIKEVVGYCVYYLKT